MKKKNPAEEAVIEQGAPDAPVKKQKKERGDARDLHGIFFTAALVLAAVSILFVVIAKNAINGSGYFSIKPFDSMKKPISIPFLTSSLCSWVSAGLAVVSVGCGLIRNFLKKQNILISYLIGLVALILAGIALLAVRYP